MTEQTSFLNREPVAPKSDPCHCPGCGNTATGDRAWRTMRFRVCNECAEAGQGLLGGVFTFHCPMHGTFLPVKAGEFEDTVRASLVDSVLSEWDRVAKGRAKGKRSRFGHKKIANRHGIPETTMKALGKMPNRDAMLARLETLE